MVQVTFGKPTILLVLICCLAAFTKAEEIKSDSIDIPIEHSSTQQQLNAFTNKNDFNGTKSIENQPKSRRKRYVAFPGGSSFSVAACETVGLIGNPKYIYMTWALNWGLVYDLPNETWILSQKNGQHKFPKPIVQRRHRRDLYSHLENIIDNMGYNGRACVLRALCESSQFFRNKSTNMAEELIRIVFTLPTIRTLPFEHPDLIMYGEAHHKGKRANLEDHCAGTYADCRFSLIALALGEYVTPTNFMF